MKLFKSRLHAGRRCFFFFVFLVLFCVPITATITCPPAGKPRVRREWRTLSPDSRHRVATAMWIMRNLTMDEGRRKYGPNFVTYEELLLLHACANFDPRCDQGHFGPVFIIFHRAMLLLFENSLIAIDPEIEAMPYWNVAYDALGGRYRNDPRQYIFSDAFFGSYRGDPQQSFAITNGLFAYFPIFEYNASRHGSQSSSNYRCLREGWIRPTRTTVCRRCCGKTNCVCDPAKDVFNTFLRNFDECSPYTTRDYEQFPLMDGTRELLFTQHDLNQCTNSTFIRSFDQWQRCIEMERSSCFFPGVDVSAIPGDDQIKIKTLAYLATESTVCSQKGFYFDQDGLRREVNAHHSQVHFKLAGDIRDPATSPNDPIFFSYHADVDRNHMTWMANTPYLEKEWWKFPREQKVPSTAKASFSGPFNIYHLIQCGLVKKEMFPEYEPYANAWIPGTLLDDVINSGYPMFNLFGETCATEPYTSRDIIELSTPSSTVYTYDTLEHLYDSCEKADMPKCTV